MRRIRFPAFNNFQVIANYLIWRAVKDSFPYLDQEARDIQQRYNQVLLSIKVAENYIGAPKVQNYIVCTIKL